MADPRKVPTPELIAYIRRAAAAWFNNEQLTALEELIARHAEVVAAAKAVMDRMPVPRGARRPEFDDLEDAIETQ
jgi:hypothetical protein